MHSLNLSSKEDSFLEGEFQALQSSDFKMNVGTDVVKIFQIDHRTLSSIHTL